MLIRPPPRIQSWKSFLTRTLGRVAALMLALTGLAGLIVVGTGSKDHFDPGFMLAAMGFVFAGAGGFAFVGVFLQIGRSRFLGRSGVLEVRQSTTLTIHSPIEVVVACIREALRAIRAREHECVGERHVEILASRRTSQIRFACHPNPDGSIEVQIVSRPWYFWQVLDGGANYSNVRQLAAAFWWREMRHRYAPERVEDNTVRVAATSPDR